MMKRIIFGFFVLLAFSLPAVSQDTTLKTNSDYKISVPNHWIEIPNDIIEQYQKVVSEATGLNQTYEYGYQSGEVENWLTYPYVLVQIKRNGRIPEGQLKKYKELKKGFDKGIKKLEESAGDFLSNMSQGETIYDSDIHVLWSSITIDVDSIGRIKGLIAVKLTEYGFIQFMGYALEQDYPMYESMYKEMVYSIDLEEKDIYKPRITDNAPTIFGINLSTTAIATIIGALIGGFFGLFAMFRRKKS